MAISTQLTAASSPLNSSLDALFSNPSVPAPPTHPFLQNEQPISPIRDSHRLFQAMTANQFDDDQAQHEAGNSSREGDDRPKLPVFLTSGEVAKMLRLSPRSFEKMRLEKRGPPYIRLGVGGRAKLIYRLADVEAWINLHASGN